jgi:hypothetical protein
MGQAIGQPILSQGLFSTHSKIEWNQHVPEIRRELEAANWDKLDRSRFQIIFGIANDKAATRLMRKFGATGKPLTITRTALLKALEEYGPDAEDQAEMERRKAFAKRLVAMEREFIESPKTPVMVPPNATRTKVSHIAEHVKLEPGRITVEFSTIEEAKKKLMLLAIAIGNEPEAFVERVEPGTQGGGE